MQRLRGYRVGAIVARLSFLVSFAVLLSGLLPAGAVLADEGPGPAVTTDAKDYRPGEIVTITGFSFLPGEIVTIAVQTPTRPDRFVESVADSSGSFTNTAFPPMRETSRPSSRSSRRVVSPERIGRRSATSTTRPRRGLAHTSSTRASPLPAPQAANSRRSRKRSRLSPTPARARSTSRPAPIRRPSSSTR